MALRLCVLLCCCVIRYVVMFMLCSVMLCMLWYISVVLTIRLENLLPPIINLKIIFTKSYGLAYHAHFTEGNGDNCPACLYVMSVMYAVLAMQCHVSCIMLYSLIFIFAIKYYVCFEDAQLKVYVLLVGWPRE